MNPWPQRCERCALPAELHPHTSWRTNGLSLGIWYVLVKQNFAACASVPFSARSESALLQPTRFLRRSRSLSPSLLSAGKQHPSASGQASEDTRPSAAIFQAGAGLPIRSAHGKRRILWNLSVSGPASARPAPSSRQAGETVFSIFRQNPYAFFPYARICSTRCVVE